MMRLRWAIVLVAALAFEALPASAQPGAKQPKFNDGYAQLPLVFEPNAGQFDPQVRYFSRGRGHALFFTDREVVFGAPDLVRMSFSGGNSSPEAEVSDRQPGVSNYFRGSDRSKWRTDVPHYGRVRYRGIYPGIDLVFHGNAGDLEFDLAVGPGADPSVIRLAYSGTDGLTLDRAGDLVTKAGGREFRLRKPVVYQDVSGKRVPVQAWYRILPRTQEIQVKLGAYDSKRAVIIDPILSLSYSTYLGGTASDQANGIAVDSSGSAYITGYANSLDFPVAAPLQGTNHGAPDVFVAKLNPAGTALVYSTYLGGSGDDRAFGIAVDANGNAYVAGTTSSTDFPTMNPLQAALAGGTDAFVAKLNVSGNRLVYSTYLGGTGDDSAAGIAVDSTGAAVIVGATVSANFPVVNAQQEAQHGGKDAFVAKLNAGGSALLYSTYLGGSSDDNAAGVAVDGAGNAYVVGSTSSADFPVATPLQPTCAAAGASDAFVTKLNSSGIAVYSTCLGGSRSDLGNAVAVDGSSNAYVVGSTSSFDFPVLNAFQPVQSDETFWLGIYDSPDGFVTKLSPTGALVYSTYFGGPTVGYYSLEGDRPGGTDSANGIAVDATGSAYVAGTTNSPGFPSLNPLQSYLGAVLNGLGTAYTSDAFTAKFDPAGGLDYSTFLGGSGSGGSAVAVDNGGNAYLTGIASNNFPLVNPFQSANASAFVAKLSYSSGVLVTFTAAPPGSITVTGQGCASGTYPTPVSLAWSQNASCSVVAAGESSGGTRYVFASWGDGSTANPRTFAAPLNSATYTIKWTTQYLLTTSVSPAGSGSISAAPTSADGYYNAGTAVTLTAVANSGYAFSFFSGDLIGTPNPQTLTMSMPHTVAANFSGACTYSLLATSVPAPAGATTQSVGVLSGAGCAWAASSNTSWIAITSGAVGAGNGSVTFSVAANLAASVRIGTLTVAGRTVTVTQGWGNAIATYNTGVAAAGGLAADGSVDSHYSLTNSADPAFPGPNAAVVNSTLFPFPYWLNDGPNSKWIGPRTDAYNFDPPGAYTYRTTFNLTGLNPAGAVLSGQCAADDSAVVELNGSVIGSCATFGAWSQFATSSGFVSTVNTLDFAVTNLGPAATPTGLRVEIVGTAPPLPGTQSVPSKVGVFRSGFLWLLDANGNEVFDGTGPGLDLVEAFGGIAGDIPITGDWSGTGTTKIGIYRASNGLFLLDYNDNGTFDGCLVDRCYQYMRSEER